MTPFSDASLPMPDVVVPRPSVKNVFSGWQLADVVWRHFRFTRIDASLTAAVAEVHLHYVQVWSGVCSFCGNMAQSLFSPEFVHKVLPLKLLLSSDYMHHKWPLLICGYPVYSED